LRGVALALTRQQGYMLEQIVDEIHAPDLAMEEVAGDYGDDRSGFSRSHLKVNQPNLAHECFLSMQVLG
jgi:hypothetical protein